MKTFKNFLTEGIKTQGKGTGTIRQNKWDELAKKEGMPTCEHKCPVHGIWHHKALPKTPCHLPAISPCEDCLFINNPSKIVRK